MWLPVPRSVAELRAWGAAHDAARASGVALRELDRADDGHRVEELTRAIWGTTEVPPPFFRALQHAGAVCIGADDPGGILVGCAIGFLGHADGLHCHSHLAGVVPAFAGRGIGRALKLGQRARCLDLGLDEMRWTYDPLLLRNAWFNLTRLGADATAFLPSFYGVMDDLQNEGDRGDRFEVRWWLADDSSAVAEPTAPTGSAVARLLDAKGPVDRPEPRPSGAEPGPCAEIVIPRDYPELRRRAPELAARWRDATARAFGRCFDAGLVATQISRDGVYRFERRRAAHRPPAGRS